MNYSRAYTLALKMLNLNFQGKTFLIFQKINNVHSKVINISKKHYIPIMFIFFDNLLSNKPSKRTTSFWRLTSITLKRRRLDVKRTLRAYWKVTSRLKDGLNTNRGFFLKKFKYVWYQYQSIYYKETRR